MVEAAPSPVDIQDFQFKLHAKLKIFDYADASYFKNASNLVVSSSRYGLVFVGTPNATLEVLQLKNIEQSPSKTESYDYLKRTIPLGSVPTHLAVNCDQSLLSVVVQKECACALIYSVISFVSQNVHLVREIRLSATPNVSMLETGWNPTMPAVYTVCKSDGSLSVYELKEASVDINEIPSMAKATCFCWSPKGKQIVVGSMNGALTQYKPDLKAVKSIPAPTLSGAGPLSVVNVFWITNYQFAAVYRDASNEEVRPAILVVNAPKAGAMTYINYEDICYSYGNLRPPQYYILHQPTWGLLMVASANSMEVGVLGIGQAGDPVIWQQWNQIDAGRAELPLADKQQETFPIGFAFDTGSTNPIPWGENQTLPAMPLIHLLSHHGVLCTFSAINMRPGAPPICAPPEPIADQSGINQFHKHIPQIQSPPKPAPPQQIVSPTPVAPPQTQPQGIKPVEVPPTATPSLGAGTLQSATQPQGFAQPPPQGLGLAQNPAIGMTQPTTQFGVAQPVVQPQVTQAQPQSVLFGSTTITPVKVTPMWNKPSIFSPENSGNSPAFGNLSQGLTTQSSETPKQLSIVPSKTPPTVPVILNVSGDSSNAIKNDEPPKIEEKPIPSEPEKPVLSNRVIEGLIVEEFLNFTGELEDLYKRCRCMSLEVGTEEEKKFLVKTDKLERFYKELEEITDSQAVEVHYLKQALIQSFAWFEDAKSRHRKYTDPNYASLLQTQSLDPVSEKHYTEIQHLLNYIKTQLQQVNDFLDNEWAEFQDSCKKNVRGKLKTPTLELIYQTLVHHNGNIRKQRYVLKDISARLRARNKKSIPNLINLSLNDNDTSTIEDELSKLKIDNVDIYKVRYDKIVTEQKKFTKTKHQKLRQFFVNRSVVHISPQKPTFTNSMLLTPSKLELGPMNKAQKSLTSVFNKIDADNSELNVSAEANISSSNLFAFPITSALTKASPEKEKLQVGKGSHFGGGDAVSSMFNFTSKPSESNFSPTSVNMSKPAFVNTATSAQSSTKPETKPMFNFAAPKPKDINDSKSDNNATLTGITFGNTLGLDKQSTPLAKAFGQAATKFGPQTKSEASTFVGAPVTTISIFSQPICSSASAPTMFGTQPTNLVVPKPTTGTSGFSLSSAFGSASTDTTKTSKSVTFSLPSQTVVKTEPSTSGGLFGSTSSTLFGSTATATTQFGNASATGSFFGSTTSTSSTGSIFGKSGTTAAGSSLFKTTISSTTSAFAMTSSASKIPADSTVSSTTTSGSPQSGKTVEASQGSIFGSATSPTTTGSIFGALTSTTTTQSSAFTAISSAPTSVAATPSTLFGAASTGSTLFGTASTPTTPSSNLFGTPTGLFGASTTAQSSAFAVTSTQSSAFSTITVPATATTQSSIPATTQSSVATTQSSIATTQSSIATTQSSTIAATPTTQTGTFAATPTTQSSLFGTPTTSVSTGFGTPAPNIFAISTASTPSIFGAAGGSIFGTPTTATGSLFGTAATTTASGSIFGAMTTAFGSTTTTSSLFGSTATTTGSLFGAPTATTQSNLFGAPTVTQSSAFGAASTQGSLFGTVATTVSTQSLFGSVTTPVSSQSGGSLFGTPASTPGNLFGGSSLAKSTSVFGGTPAVTTASAFATPQATTTGFSFLQSPTATTASFGFGTPTTAAESFGFNLAQTSADPNKFSFGNLTVSALNPNASSSSASNFSFTSPTNTTTQSSTFNPFGGGAFQSTVTTTASSFMGQNICRPSAFGGSAGFGQTGSIFGQKAATTTATQVFGTNTGSIFGTPTSTATSTTSSIFGQNTTTSVFGQSAFGTPTTTTSSFGGSFTQNPSSSPFGGTPTSAFGAKPAFGQTAGFGQSPTFGGAPAFGAAPAFGSPTPATQSSAFGGFGSPPAFQKPAFGTPPSFGQNAFGGQPAFGGSPGFGGQQRLFGSPGSAPANTFGSPGQESSTFANLATQNTLGFGSLAQNQNQAPAPPAQPAQFSGGSSFSSWR